MSTIPLPAQAEAAERAAMNLRNHVDHLRNLVAHNKRPQHELDIALAWLPALEACAHTMRQMAGEGA